jgi:hypothetical protein
LEKQDFKWLKPDTTASLCTDGYQLNLLLDELDVFNNKPHETLFYSAIN